MRRFPMLAILGVAVFLARPSAGPKFVFENVIGRSGIQYVMNNSAIPQKHQVETMLAGVALFDYNNDGLLDIYFVNGAKLPEMDKSDPRYWNRVYHNNCDGTLADVTAKAGVEGIHPKYGKNLGHQRGLVRLRQRRPAGPDRRQLRQLEPADRAAVAGGRDPRLLIAQ